mmetsp:Transcript_55215/g.139461  ORF Transcript_55215/g.139461 Transcript_55215/m.139461 type:complete len:606 (-) Transcript_55215:7381-9198(-)
MAEHQARYRARKALGDAAELKTYDAADRDLIHGRLLQDCKRFIIALQAGELLSHVLHGLRRGMPHVPRSLRIAWPLLLVALCEGATGLNADAARGLARDDPTIALGVPEQEAICVVRRKDTLALDQPVDRYAKGTCQLEEETIEDLVVPSTSADEDILLREVEVRGLADKGKGVVLFLSHKLHAGHAARGTAHALEASESHGTSGCRQGLARPLRSTDAARCARLRQHPSLSRVDAFHMVFLLLGLPTLAIAGDERHPGQLHALRTSALSCALNNRAQHARLVETRERRAHVGEGHLALALCVDHVLVHMLWVLDDCNSMHHVVLPIRDALLLDGAVPPMTVVGDPQAAAVTTSCHELAHVGATTLPGRAQEVLDAVSMRQVVPPLTVVGNMLELGVVAILAIVLEEAVERVALEGLRCKVPSRGMGPIARRPTVASFKTLLERGLLASILVVERAHTLPLSVLSELSKVVAAAPLTGEHEVRPCILPTDMASEQRHRTNGVVLESSIEQQHVVHRPAERGPVALVVLHADLGCPLEADPVCLGPLCIRHEDDIVEGNWSGGLPNVCVLNRETFAPLERHNFLHGLRNSHYLLFSNVSATKRACA